MEIKILGTGCPKCRRLEQIAREAAAEAGINATFTKVTDIDAILSYPISSTPALVIDEEVKCSGILPRREEVLEWLKQVAQ